MCNSATSSEISGLCVAEGVEVIIATPGTLNDLVMDGIIDVSSVTKLVLDEADCMLKMGFEPQIREVLLGIRPYRQTVMTSATWSAGVQQLAQSCTRNPVQVFIGTAVPSVTQKTVIVEEKDKFSLLLEFVKNMDPDDRVIVFVGKEAQIVEVAHNLTVSMTRDQMHRTLSLEGTGLMHNANECLIFTAELNFKYFQSSAQRNPVYCNIYAFYRVNLAMFEAKLYNIRRIQEAPTQMAEEVYEIPARPDFLLVTQTVNVYPDQIGQVLKSAGPIAEGGEYLVHALAAEHRTRNGILVPQSEQVILSNLRETVTALANIETAPQVREAFYQHNPIPGAIWRIVNGTHVLVNADEIMPPKQISTRRGTVFPTTSRQ
jgi:hypothetical protein